MSANSPIPAEGKAAKVQEIKTLLRRGEIAASQLIEKGQSQLAISKSELSTFLETVVLKDATIFEEAGIKLPSSNEVSMNLIDGILYSSIEPIPNHPELGNFARFGIHNPNIILEAHLPIADVAPWQLKAKQIELQLFNLSVSDPKSPFAKQPNTNPHAPSGIIELRGIFIEPGIAAPPIQLKGLAQLGQAFVPKTAKQLLELGLGGTKIMKALHLGTNMLLEQKGVKAQGLQAVIGADYLQLVLFRDNPVNGTLFK